MKMTHEKKNAAVKELATRLERSESLYLTDFSGIAVKPMTELRRKLRDAGVEYVVVKNTLALRALKQASVSGLDDLIRGPTGFVFAGADALAAAKILSQFQKEHELLTVRAGLVDGRTMSAQEVRRLATLPSRDELLAQVGGALQAPLQGFAGAVTSLLYQFAGAVEALRAQRASA
jgi:large subunit ribosomal protein L10